jgi:hypothetical protein
MNPIDRKFISLFLVFSLMAISCITIGPREKRIEPEKRGANLVIMMKDGGQIRGELISVKEDSLLLLDTGVFVDIAGIKVIRIVRKSKASLGAGIGAVIVGIGGALFGGKLVGTFEGDDEDILIGSVIGGALGAASGAGWGAIIGAIAGTDKTIQIERKTDLEIRETLDRLRKKARVRD